MWPSDRFVLLLLFYSLIVVLIVVKIILNLYSVVITIYLQLFIVDG
jgi:hypothetical protein